MHISSCQVLEGRKPLFLLRFAGAFLLRFAGAFLLRFAERAFAG